MSSRALRKLNQTSLEDELAKYTSGSPEVDDSSEDERPVKAKVMNAFAFLGEEDDEDEDEDEEQEEKPEEQEEEKEEEKKQEPPVVALKKSKSKKKSKKKKGKAAKSKKLNKEEEEDEEDNDYDEELAYLDEQLKFSKSKTASDAEELGEEDNDVADALDESTHNEIVDSDYTHFTTNNFKQSLKLLKVETREFDPDNEFKNLFGSDLSTSAIEDADSTSSVPPEVLAQIKKLARRVKGWSGKDRRSVPGLTRKLTLTKIKDDWLPTRTKMISMSELSKDTIQQQMNEKRFKAEQRLGVRHFRFYENVDQKPQNSEFFISTVLAPDHEALILHLQRNPYHVETILQVSAILLRQGDKSNSGALVERALFVFDWALKQNFELGSGLMRLPFENFLTRQFYLALFRYLQVLTQRSTFYTALQYCKLMLSLNPTEDPYGVRYFIDFYAIMAGEYKYLVELVDSPLVSTYTQWLTPSLVYSKVLAILLEEEGTEEAKYADAKQALAEAFKLHPYTGYRLLEVVGMGGGSRSAFNKDISLYDKVAAETYVIRAKIMWGDEPRIRDFINKELSLLLESSAPTTGGVGSFFSSFFGRNTGTKEQEVPINLIRHVILSGESQVMAKLPLSFWDDNKENTLEFDVFPPDSQDVEKFTDFTDPYIISAQMELRLEEEGVMAAIRLQLEEQQLQDAQGGQEQGQQGDFLHRVEIESADEED